VVAKAALLALAVAGALVLAACGGDPAREASLLPAALADRLADQADRVAARLEAGDPCAALAEADRLRARVRSEIAEGRIPRAMRAPLVDAVRSLAAAISCEPDPPATEAPNDATEAPNSDDDKANERKEKEEGKEDRGRGNGGGDGGDGEGDDD
jgi:hypothetical protein